LPPCAEVRGATAGAGAAGRQRGGGGVVGVRAQQKPTKQPRSGAVGQWAGAVRIVRRGRRSPERVWTLLVLPLESLPAALTVKGAGGEKQPGRTPTLVLTLSGWLLFRKAARALCGLLIHEPPRSSWATRPPPQPMRAPEGDGWSDIKIIRGACGAIPQQPTASNPTARAKPTAQGQRAKGLKNQEGSLGGRSSRDGRQRRC
jgi:hypothetical protein